MMNAKRERGKQAWLLNKKRKLHDEKEKVKTKSKKKINN